MKNWTKYSDCFNFSFSINHFCKGLIFIIFILIILINSKQKEFHLVYAVHVNYAYYYEKIDVYNKTVQIVFDRNPRTIQNVRFELHINLGDGPSYDISYLPYQITPFYCQHCNILMTIFNPSATTYQPNFTNTVYLDNVSTYVYKYDLIPGSSSDYIIGQMIIDQQNSLLQIKQIKCQSTKSKTYSLKVIYQNGTSLTERDGNPLMKCNLANSGTIAPSNFYVIKQANQKVLFQLEPQQTFFASNYIYRFYFKAIAFKNCIGVKHSTQVAVNQTSCQCLSPLFYDETKDVCERNCSLHNRSQGILQSDPSQCSCQFEPWDNQGKFCPCKPGQHFYYNSTDDQCYRNCSQIDYTDGLKDGSKTQCNCLKNFIWVDNLSICKRQCHKYKRNSGLLPNSYWQCDCWYGKWNNIQYCPCRPKEFYYFKKPDNCQRDCSQIIGTLLKLKQGSITQCECPSGYFWDQSRLTCIRQCLTIKETQGLKNNSNDSCICKYGGQFNLQNLTCPSPENYLVDPITNTFYIDCSTIKGATQLKQNSFNQCLCKPKFIWDSLKEKCICKQGFYLLQSETQYTCCKDCSQISNANISKQSLNQNQKNNKNLNEDEQYCICIDLYYWNESEKSCKSLCQKYHEYINDNSNQNNQDYGLIKYLYRVNSCQKVPQPVQGWSIIVIVVVGIVIIFIILMLIVWNFCLPRQNRTNVMNQISGKMREIEKEDSGRHLDTNEEIINQSGEIVTKQNKSFMKIQQ